MARSIPSVQTPPPPPPVICRAVVILSVPGVGICQKTSVWGWGVRQFFQERLTSLLFQYFTKKYIYIYLGSFVKNIFNTYALKRCACFRSITSLPQSFLHPSKKLLPPIVICWPWRKNN